MNSIIEAHNEFIEQYNERPSFLSMLCVIPGHERVIKSIKPEVALYEKFQKPELSIEEKLLFLLQDKLGIKNTAKIKEAIPFILELTDPDNYEPFSHNEKAVEYEPSAMELRHQKDIIDMFNVPVNINDNKFNWHERSAIKSDPK
jgi:hypothetical protein